MNDTVFKTRVEPVAEETPTTSSEQAKPVSSIEVPYLDYTREHGQPFPVDHYQLGRTWQDPDGGFYQEVNTIEDYISGQIERAEIPNSIEAVKARLKEIEKLTRVPKEERPVVKISTVAAYMRFLNETNKVKSNLRKYGHSQ